MIPASPSPAPTGWRRFFIGVQIALGLAWCGVLTDTFPSLSAVVYLVAVVLLLFVLPWFWSSLRHVALIGWLVGAASLYLPILLGPLHR